MAFRNRNVFGQYKFGKTDFRKPVLRFQLRRAAFAYAALRRRLVLGTGLEPARLAATASKTVVYAIPPPERIEFSNADCRFSIAGGKRRIWTTASPERPLATA